MEDASQYANALITIEMPYAMASAICGKCNAGQRLSLPERQQIVRDFFEAIHEFEVEHDLA